MEYKTYMCVICGFIYEEEKGLPEEGFAPGTRWEDIPDTWICPDCDASYLIEKNTKRHGRQLVCDSESCNHAEAAEA